MNPLFVLGTGRCGSTSLSNFIKDVSQTLSISEFFSHVTNLSRNIGGAFTDKPISSIDFWNIISAPIPDINKIISQYGSAPEWLLPAHSGGIFGKFENPVPSILLTTLPHLGGDFQSIFDGTKKHVLNNNKIAMVGYHYTELFRYWASIYSKNNWVERSGGNLHILSQLTATFPNAKFLHLIRDGRNTALSMAKHPLFRYRIGLPPFIGGEPSGKDLYMFGTIWSTQISRGVDELLKIRGDRVVSIKIEDSYDHGNSFTNRICEFLSFNCESGLESRYFVAGRSNYRRLSRDKRSCLEDACEDGFSALRRLQVPIVYGAD